MRVWHMGQAEHHDRIDGVNAVVWLVAEAQARLGAQPVLVHTRTLTREASAFAATSGIEELRVAGFDPRAIREALARSRPRLVHFHSVFVPQHAVLAHTLRSEGVPYVLTPHGGVSPFVLSRGRVKKLLYSSLIERDRFHGATALTAVTSGEVDEIRAFAPYCVDPIRVVANPVAARLFAGDARSPAPPNDRPRLTYLGRFDVQLKGIDRLYRVAELLPEADVRLVGTAHSATRRAHLALERHRPVNLELAPPVYGAAKVAELDATSMYIQMSRSEAFGLAVAEAMARGVPVAITEEMHLASAVAQAEAGLVLSAEPARAAEQLREALRYPDHLYRLGCNGRAYAFEHFLPEAVAQAYLDVYDDIT